MNSSYNGSTVLVLASSNGHAKIVKYLIGSKVILKHLAYRHILKTAVKVVEEKFKFLCFSSLPAIRRADPPPPLSAQKPVNR